MGGFSGFVDFLGNKEGGFEGTLKKSVGGFGAYLVDEADKKSQYEPKKADRTPTFYERYGQQSMQPTWDNPAVQKAAYASGDNSAATAAARIQAQNKQLGKTSTQAPEYWRQLVALATGLNNSAEGIKTTSALSAYSSKAIEGAVNTMGGSGGSKSSGSGSTYENGDTYPNQSTGTYDSYDFLDSNWYR